MMRKVARAAAGGRQLGIVHCDQRQTSQLATRQAFLGFAVSHVTVILTEVRLMRGCDEHACRIRAGVH